MERHRLSQDNITEGSDQPSSELECVVSMYMMVTLYCTCSMKLKQLKQLCMHNIFFGNRVNMNLE